MDKHPEIIYDGKPCRILTSDKFLNGSHILIENKLGRVDWLQKFITQDELKRALKGKQQPKFDKDKAFRIMYEGKAVSDFMSYALCVNKKKALEKTGHYKQPLKIEQ